MCGIAGVINQPACDLGLLKSGLRHRGPDSQTEFTDGNVSLVHTRLSIIDIKNAHQPMHYGRYSIVFNGEIYNYHDLKRLLKFNHFETQSDTEILLHLYIQYKERMFEHIDGMFAFAILDRDANQLFLARDRAGKKPLYYTKCHDGFIFASELNTLASVLDTRVDEEAVAGYVRSGFFYQNQTAYQDVFELLGGHYMTVDLTSMLLSSSPYFNMVERYLQKQNDSFDEAMDKVDHLLHMSVKDRLLSSDLEVGAFLSGGIDSNLVVAIASQYQQNLKTFTVRFDGGYDESALAKLAADHYGTDHNEISVSVDLKNDIEMILGNYGEPFMDSSAIPSFYVSREAKKYVTVILNGDGADELFGGYRRYVPFVNRWLKGLKYFSGIAHLLPKAHNKQSVYNYVTRLMHIYGAKDPVSRYLLTTNDIFEGYEEHLANYQMKMREGVSALYQLPLSDLSKQMLGDYQMLLFSDLLVKMDIATMSNSLEGRSPFLSKYFLEYVPGLPDQYKVNGTTTKYLLRMLAKKYIPAELIQQPKRGFEVPLKSWVENDLKEMVFDHLKKGCYADAYVNRSFIDRLLSGQVDVSREKRAKMLWTMFCLVIWEKNLNRF